MENATQILTNEHKDILKVTRALSNECDEIESGKAIDRDFFFKAVDFIKNYADKFHHAKEEDILFVELCRDEAQMHCNPTQQMIHEHDLGRSFVRGLEEGLRQDNKTKIIENSRNYSQLIQEHIFKEDNILYPMADEALNQKSKKSILEKFKKAESKFSKGSKEKYSSIAEEFEKRK